MSNLVIGLSLTGILLGWVLIRYFSASKQQDQMVAEQRIKDAKYQRVLESAKAAEREEKIFKAQTGHVASQLSLAKEYELTNVQKAIEWYAQAAEQDNDIAQNALARLCRLNQDDPDGAAKSKYWEQVVRAKGKQPEALFELGRYQVRGFGCGVDIEAGIENITTAAEKNYIAAQQFLGDWFVAELNSKKEPFMAFCWRLRSAINEDATGCIRTAFCYQSGLGVEKDRTCAIYWLERAAELGNSEAQYLAGKMHLGHGATDSAIAYTWFSIANASGHKQAKTERDDVVQFISIESILNVQNVANSIFKLLKKQPLPTHKVIDLLDRVYGRDGYRPREEMLEVAAVGQLDEGLYLQLLEESNVAEAFDNSLTYEVLADADKPSDEITNVAAPDDVQTDEQQNIKNETAAKEYQQQNWATSWDNISVEMDKS
ncbi:TPR repeat protein, SEL1 subfamily [Photobacterium marinum]|uniref:TPR repeat protein, SEL1 subfamily n=1 Tax=Photobacterium marinum TaxID=1056511 RepID=L8JGG7_9GAMM|nr:tetratricopeptide repeat protein [Photobacterium marinum]ELR66522.1 TPR repeat protein, SEL1 subfamily [Photobacterium marinum]